MENRNELTYRRFSLKFLQIFRTFKNFIEDYQLEKFTKIFFENLKMVEKVNFDTVNELTGAPRHQINNELKTEDNLSGGQISERETLNKLQ